MKMGRVSEDTDQWPKVSLRDICLLFDSGVWGKAPGDDDRVYPVLRSNNIQNGEIDLSDVAIRAFSTMIPTTKFLSSGDILVTKSSGSSSLVGKSAMVSQLDNASLFSNFVLRMRMNREVAVPSFIIHYLHTPQAGSALSEMQDTTTGLRNLDIGRYGEQMIPLPPPAEQRRIVAALRERLEAVAQARAAASAQLEAAKALREVYIHRTFQGITPLAVGSVRDPTPSGWRWTRLTDLARLESGHTPSRYHPEWWGGDIPWIALPDIRDLDGKTAHRTIEYTNESGIAHSSARVLPAGTVVLSRTASVGFVTIMGREMATSQDFVNWVCGPDIAPEFLSYLLQASRSYIRSLSSGATHQTVYVPAVKAFDVCVPRLNEQLQLANALTTQLTQATGIVDSTQQGIQAIEALTPALLRQAFSGGL